MSSSINSQHLEAVASDIGEGYLASRCFHRTGHTFRRELEPGFVQIIELGLGPSWSMYAGHFTVDIYVFIREAYELFFSKRSPYRPTGTHCELRMRLGRLDCPPKDEWWDVSLPRDMVVPQVGKDIERLALPFLASIASRQTFVDTWFAKGNDALGLPPRGDLIVTAVFMQLGNYAAAKEVLKRALEAAAGQRHEAFYSKVAARLGA